MVNRAAAAGAVVRQRRGVEPGFRLLGAAGALSSDRRHPLARVALSLGLSHDVTARELVEHLAAAHGKAPIPPKLISADEAPCKQNILLGEEATLDRFPIPLVHQDDGGRYVNTWGIIVASTPDGRWTNWSISRIMMIDGRHMTGLFLPQQHIGMIWAEWEKIGKPMPFAVVQGGDPGVPMIGGMPIPADVDEGSFLGTLYGEPVEVVKCETIDLDVPATAEEACTSSTRYEYVLLGSRSERPARVTGTVAAPAHHSQPPVEREPARMFERFMPPPRRSFLDRWTAKWRGQSERAAETTRT